jgi:hypothetical protein
VIVLAVLLLSTAWCIPHLGVRRVDHNSSRVGAITHNSNHDNFSNNSHNNSSNNSSTMLLLYHCSRLPLGRHISFSSATSHASTVGRWATLLENAASPSKATHRELWPHGEPAEGPSEGSCTTHWPRQLHHCGGDSHGRSASGYILPQ